VALRSPIGLVLFAALLLACATPPTEADLEQRLERLGSATQGLRRPRVVAIHADTRAVAFGLLMEARANADSPLSVAVSRRLAAAHLTHRDLVAGGPFGDLNDRVLCNALALQQEKNLSGLQLVFASPDPPSRALLVAAGKAHVRLLHRSFR
jgi:hypothetical protein